MNINVKNTLQCQTHRQLYIPIIIIIITKSLNCWFFIIFVCVIIIKPVIICTVKCNYSVGLMKTFMIKQIYMQLLFPLSINHFVNKISDNSENYIYIFIFTTAERWHVQTPCFIWQTVQKLISLHVYMIEYISYWKSWNHRMTNNVKSNKTTDYQNTPANLYTG